VLLILGGVFVGAAAAFPAKLHLLGDGALLQRVLSGNKVMDEVPPNFNHQPGVGLVFQFLVNYMKSDISLSAEGLFREIGIVSGILFLILLFFFLRSQRLAPADNFLCGLYLFCAAGSQFFFGYVELYVLLYVTMFAYLTSAWYVLENTLSRMMLVIYSIVCILCFALLCAWHYASIVFAPTLLILMMGITKKNRAVGFSFIGILSIIGAGGFWLKKDSLGNIIENVRHETWYNFLPLFTPIEYFPYTMFSFAHVVDWLNALMLITPFGLIIIIAIVSTKTWNIQEGNLTMAFYLSMAVVGLLFTFTMNPALGLARDWDFLASFFLPLVVLSVLVSKQFFSEPKFKLVFLGITFLTFFHWIGWIGVNASEERHLNRVELLNEPKLLSLVPRRTYYETLGNFYWFRGDYLQSRMYWENFYSIDSTNPRTVANLSEVYRKLGENEKTFHLLKRTAELGSPSPAVYMNLGVMYAQHGDTNSAIAFNERAVSMDSSYAKAHANLGFLYSRRGRYSDAAVHLQKALFNGLEEPFIFRELGSVYFFQNKFDSSLAYYNKYLTLVPNDSKAQNVRDQLELFIRKM
jgi:Tfp pilus assembly protein PilF